MGNNVVTNHQVNPVKFNFKMNFGFLVGSQNYVFRNFPIAQSINSEFDKEKWIKLSAQYFWIYAAQVTNANAKFEYYIVHTFMFPMKFLYETWIANAHII